MSFVAPVATGSPLAALLGQQFAPIATPRRLQRLLARCRSRSFTPQLQSQGLLPVAGVGGSSSITPLGKVTDQTLAPGTSVSVAAGARRLLGRGLGHGNAPRRRANLRLRPPVPQPRLGRHADVRVEGRDGHPEHTELFQADGARPDGRHHLAGSLDRHLRQPRPRAEDDSGHNQPPHQPRPRRDVHATRSPTTSS